MSLTEASRGLMLHTVRLLGYAASSGVAARAGLAVAEATEALREARSAGHVVWSRFGDDGGWSLTEAGRSAGESLLADELDATGARPVVESVMVEFEALNARVTTACTSWQLTEAAIAASPTSLDDVIDELHRSGEQWAALEDRLIRVLPRFGGYHRRFTTAVDRARSDPAWVAAIDRDSAHRVWFELHEDLLATLGRSR